MRYYSIILPLLFLSISSFSKAGLNHDSILNHNDYLYLELLGDGMIYSINFDKHIYAKNKFEASFSIGMTYHFMVEDINDFYGFGEIFDLKTFYSLGDRHKVGLDVGFSYYLLNDGLSEYELGILTSGLDYKYMFSKSKYYFRAKLGPFFPVIVDEKFTSIGQIIPLYIGLGFGIAL